ncbi:MAG: type IV toxin-antitoxin system AbiEi family antitoxin [Prosthecobacter sp.]|uniref:type IV toxin-antitoxin system AbiEi family antitoxin n=1 Tax=Prosthecobacter sp. TaxID=1965333 RepID=UPI003900DE99
MKTKTTAKKASPQARAIEKALAQKLRELLGSVAWLKGWDVSVNPAAYGRVFDLMAVVPLPKQQRAELWVECDELPRPSRFPHVSIKQTFHPDGDRTLRIPVLAAPLISPRVAELCQQHGWSWFDLAGNCRLNVPGALYIERRGQQATHQRPKPVAKLNSAEAARVVRSLLAIENTGRRWTQRALQVGCQPAVSIGLINKLVLHLREEAYLAADAEGGFRVSDAPGMLAAWSEAYRFERHSLHGYFTLKQGRALDTALARLRDVAQGHAALAAFSAAEQQAPHVRQPKTWLYVGAEWEDEMAELLDAKPVDSGENLVVLIPEDSGVFYLPQTGTAALPCTNAAQTFVDLMHCGGRGKEAAEAVLDKMLKPAWQKKGPKK